MKRGAALYLIFTVCFVSIKAVSSVLLSVPAHAQFLSYELNATEITSVDNEDKAEDIEEKEASFVEYSTEDLIVLEVEHQRGGRADFIDAIYDDPDLFLNWEDFLDFGSYPYQEIDPNVYRISMGNGNGELIADLSIPSLVYEATGEELSIEEDIGRADDDFFISERLLQTVFGVTVSLQISSLSMLLQAEDLLPYEILRVREERRNKLGESSAEQTYISYQQINDRYRLLDFPFIDASAYTDIRSFSSGNELENSWRYNVRGAGDIGLLNAEWSARGRDERELQQLRFKAGRRSETPNLLGIGATSFYIGDLYAPRISGLMRGSRGRGLEVSNFPLRRSRSFTETEIRGNVSPGWEVELYRGRRLIDYVEADIENGEYIFSEVELRYGNNDFKVVSYGPQGQVEERRIKRYVGRDLIQPGKLYYTASFTQHETPLFETERPGFENQWDGDPRLFTELELGISRRISAYSWAYSLPLGIENGEQHTYLSSGMRSNVGQLTLDGSLIKDVDSGYALRGELQTRLPLRWRVSGYHIRMYDDFVMEANLGTSRRYESLTRLSLSGRFPLGLRTRTTATDYRFDSGRHLTRVENQLSRRFGNLHLINRVNSNIRETGNGIDNARGFLTARYRLSRQIMPQAELRYVLLPVAEARQLQIGADWRPNGKLNVQTRLNRSLGISGNWSASLRVNRRFGAFQAGINGYYNSNSSFRAGFSLSTSLARNPLNGRIRAYDRPLSRSSGIATFIYNEIPETNPGRAGIEGAELLAGGSSRGLEADEEGMIFSTRIRSWNPTEISVKESSLLDPAMQAPPAGYRYLSRPGKVFRRELQIRITSEAEGIVYEVDGANREDNLRPLANVPVLLIRQEGTAADTSGAAENTESVAQQMRSVFDGYYIFDGIREGSYRIEVDPEWLAEQELRMLTEAYEFEVTGDGTIFRNVDIVLGPLVEEDEIDFERDAFLLTEAERQELEQELQDQGMLLPCGEEIDFGTIYFGPNGDTLDEAALEIVREHAELMFEYPELTMLIEGFTAAIGDEIYNLRLSRRRAWAVQRALVELGVHPDRMFVRGRGQIEEPCEEEDDTGCGNHRKVIAVRYSVFELLFFDQDDPTLNQAQREKLATNLDILRVCEDVQVRVEALSDYRTGPQEAFEVVQQRRDEVLEFYIDQGLPEDRIDIELGVGSRFELPVAEEPDENRTQVLTVDANTAAFFKADRQRKTYTVQLASSGVLDNARERSQALSEALGQPTNVYYKPEEDLYIVTLAIEGSAFLAEREMYRVRRDVDFRTAFLLPMEGLQDVQLGTEGLYEVRFGAFSSNEAAERVRDFINSFSSEQAVVVYSEREDVYRVITREALERDRAAFIIDEARRNGHDDLLILRLSELE